jgi:hypothetical protein
VKKYIFILLAATIVYGSCSKSRIVSPVRNKSFKVTVTPDVSNIANSTWQQVLGGEAIIQFTAENSDTLSASPVSDSLNLKNISAYSKQLVAGTYDITLATESTAVADTFIRFNALINGVAINKDQTISMNAATTDGVITISKSLIDTATTPTFTPTGTTTPYNFGLANGYYFMYVKDAGSGRITFNEATSGDLYLKDITVSALNQYDISVILNASDVIVHLFPFRLKTNLK